MPFKKNVSRGDGRRRLRRTRVVVLGPSSPPALPLDNLGLEHLDIVVPDTAASAKFYARIFKSALHQQPVRDTLRYFVLLGDLPADRQVGYIAIGAATGGRRRSGTTACSRRRTTAPAFASALEAAGSAGEPTAPGPIGMWPDPDGLELQLFQPPAGLVTAAVDVAAASRRRRAAHAARRRSRDAERIESRQGAAVLPAGLRRGGRTAARRQRPRLVLAGAQHAHRSAAGRARRVADDRPLRDQGRAVRSRRA